MRTIPTDFDTETQEPQGAQRLPRKVPCASCGLPTEPRPRESVAFCPACLDHAFLDEWSDQWDDLGGEG